MRGNKVVFVDLSFLLQLLEHELDYGKCFVHVGK
jgi:hypothetical protein